MAGHGAVIVVGSKEQWDSLMVQSKNEAKVIIVDFSATWCGPCRVIGPIFAELSTKYPSIMFLKVDVDDVGEVAEECRISAMPTFQVFVNGEKADELVGASKDKLLLLVQKYA